MWVVAGALGLGVDGGDTRSRLLPIEVEFAVMAETLSRLRRAEIKDSLPGSCTGRVEYAVGAFLDREDVSWTVSTARLGWPI